MKGCFHVLLVTKLISPGTLSVTNSHKTRTTRRGIWDSSQGSSFSSKLPSASPVRTSSPEHSCLRASQYARKGGQELLTPSKSQHSGPNGRLLNQGNGGKWGIIFPWSTQFLEPGGDSQVGLCDQLCPEPTEGMTRDSISITKPGESPQREVL